MPTEPQSNKPHKTAAPGPRPHACSRRLALPPLALALALILLACAPRPLSTRGSVKVRADVPDAELAQTAAKLSGLSYSELSPQGSWRRQLEARSGAPDLVLVDRDRELDASAAAGELADISRYWARLSSIPAMRKSLASSLVAADAKAHYFLPTSLYPWGLFYNIAILKGAGIAPPSTLAELEDSFGHLAGKGITPLALGASYGWPALAWLSILDIRQNGAAAHRLLLEGKRSFDDPGLLEVCATLERWRDRGYFPANAAKLGWNDALGAVDNGSAAFAFLSASALAAYRRKSALGFMALPPGRSADGRGELAIVRGFALSAHASAPQAALALADAYALDGAPGQTTEPWTLPAVAQEGPGEKEGFRAAEARILDGASEVLPQLDWALPAQAAIDARAAMTRFFEKRGGMSSGELAAALAKAAAR